MFTPLANSKNRTTEIDRLDNSVVASNTSTKVGGYKIDSNTYWNDKSEGTFVVSAFPNSSDLRYSNLSNGNRFKWMFLNFEGDSSGWFSPCIATENNIQIGGPDNYPPGVLDINGWNKGQMGVQCRFTVGGTADGLILINSGSTYDWDNPTPITIAFGVSDASQLYNCSINGETAAVVQYARNSDPDWDGYQWVNSLSGNSSVTFGYSPGDFDEILMSGSYYEFNFYESPLNQEEMNTITGQPYGLPTNVLNKQPDIRYVLTQENKDAANEFSNLGTDGSYTQKLKPQFETAGQITSGSVFDSGIQDYRERL
tara:strand:+ start:4920 stop:5855 length:936 start_codon:yes stop_codon:yes gene_type:complete